jgi:uncharacterized membrane protein
MNESQPSSETPEERDIRLNKDVAAFSYIWIMSVIIYAARKDSPFIRFHAKQGIVLFLFSVVIALIPVIGKYLMLLVVAGMLMGFIHAAQGHKQDVPLIGKLSRGELALKEVIDALMAAFKALSSLFHSKSSTEETKKSEPAGPPNQTGNATAVATAVVDHGSLASAVVDKPRKPPVR